MVSLAWFPSAKGYQRKTKADNDKQKQTNTEKYRQNVGGPGHPGWPLFARWVWCVSAIVC